MTPRETRFILRAHRNDGRYAPDDPLFAAALAEADRSSELSSWLEREHALDATVANKLDAIVPPPGLRETILAGARASRMHRSPWPRARWLALAASVAVIVSVSVVARWKRLPDLNAGAFAHLAVEEYATHLHHHDYPAPLAAIATALGERKTPLTAGLDLSTDKLRTANCARMNLGDHEAYEICFQRDGTWFHLYVTHLDRPGAPDNDRHPIFLQQDKLAAASWSDGTNLYSLVTRAGQDALARVV